MARAIASTHRAIDASMYASAAVSAASSSSSQRSSSVHQPRPFPGRSGYDFEALLVARERAWAEHAAAQLREQGAEEAAAHAAKMEEPISRIKEISVTDAQLRSWQRGGLSHTQQCGICLDAFRRGSSASLLPCAHVFHSACLTPWLARSALCPMCRFDLLRNCTEEESRRRDEEERRVRQDEEEGVFRL